MDSAFLMRHTEELRDFIDFLTSSIAEVDILDPRLRMAGDDDLETFYAPFEYINLSARVTIIGLTPGQTQARIALNETRSALRNGLAWHDAIKRAKYLASFGGSMRTNLTKMLDHIGLHKWLGVDTCLQLFTKNTSLAHHTSLLRFPVFKDRLNYSGQPAIDRIGFLREQVDRWFSTELADLSQSVFVPLGPQVQNVFMRLARDHGIAEDRCLVGLPHPSGANAERIAYFLGTKSKDTLSRQTNGDVIDLVREQLVSKVRALTNSK